jgi:cytochrome c-type biogenesis protein CcmH/NrfG
MSLILVRLRLAVYLSLFMAELLAIYLQHIRPLLWSLVILIVMGMGLSHAFLANMNQVKQEQITAVSLPEKITHDSPLFTRTAVEEKLQEYENILKTQPQHRDILVNIALLQRALHNQKEAFVSWEEARKLDPNNPLFSAQDTPEKATK